MQSPTTSCISAALSRSKQNASEVVVISVHFFNVRNEEKINNCNLSTSVGQRYIISNKQNGLSPTTSLRIWRLPDHSCAAHLINHWGQMCISIGSLQAGDGLGCISDRMGLYVAARLRCQSSEAHRFLHLFIYLFFFPVVAGRLFNNAWTSPEGTALSIQALVCRSDNKVTGTSLAFSLSIFIFWRRVTQLIHEIHSALTNATYHCASRK